jgi:hypothetical protein
MRGNASSLLPAKKGVVLSLISEEALIPEVEDVILSTSIIFLDK